MSPNKSCARSSAHQRERQQPLTAYPKPAALNCNFLNINMQYSSDHILHLQELRKLELYPKTQLNAQKYLGPPTWYCGNVPGKHTEVYLTNLPKNISEEEIFYHANKFGIVYQVRLPVTYTEAKGYAFVRFFGKEEANRAIQELNKSLLGGREVRAELSRDSKILLVRNWPKAWTHNDSLAVVKRALEESVVGITIFPEIDNPLLNMGFVLIEFVSHDAAARARRNIKDLHVFGSYTAAIHEVEDLRQDHEIPEDKFEEVHQLFLGGFNSEIPVTSEELRNSMRACLSEDEVANTLIKLHPEGYAFLCFGSHAQAKEAYIRMRGKGISVRGIKLRVHWVKGEFLPKRSMKAKQATNNVEMPAVPQPYVVAVQHYPASPTMHIPEVPRGILTEEALRGQFPSMTRDWANSLWTHQRYSQDSGHPDSQDGPTPSDGLYRLFE